MNTHIEADVVIVGSGVAGSLVAWRLVEAKLKVLILEAGPRIDRLQAFQSFVAAREKNFSAPFPPVAHAPTARPNAWSDYYVNTGPDLFRGTYTRAVGGSTWHWAGSALRYRPNDFRMKSSFGLGVDWPLAYEQIAPFYDEAEQVLGVAGSKAEDWGAPRRSDYPMPPIPPTYLDTVVGEVLRPLGMSLAVFPQARNSVEYDERPRCCGSASCVPLCPSAAKYDAAVHAIKAERAGARLEADAVVHRIETDSNRQISTVHFLRPDRSTGSAAGRVVVLAANAIETPKLLLMSRDERTPKGVANSSNAVGHYLMGQIDQGTRGLTKVPIYPYRGPVLTSAIPEFRDGPFRSKHSACRNLALQRGVGTRRGPASNSAQADRPRSARQAPAGCHRVAYRAPTYPGLDGRAASGFDQQGCAGRDQARRYRHPTAEYSVSYRRLCEGRPDAGSPPARGNFQCAASDRSRDLSDGHGLGDRPRHNSHGG